MSSKTCNGITLKGKKCNRNVSKNNMYCFQHINQSIKHYTPAIQPINIVSIREKIKNNSKDSHCSKKNKYGEYICKEQCVPNSKNCEKHNLEFIELSKDLKRIFNSSKINVSYYHVSLDRKFKIYEHMVNYMKKHKEKIIYLGDKPINAFIDSIKGSLNVLSNELYESNHFLKPWKLRKQNKNYEYYKSKLELHISELQSIIPSVQIKKNIDTFVSNSIKLQKVSECYVKFGNSHLPVICKGINEKILSFIV